MPKACRVCGRSDVKFPPQRNVCHSCLGKKRRGTLQAPAHSHAVDSTPPAPSPASAVGPAPEAPLPDPDPTPPSAFAGEPDPSDDFEIVEWPPPGAPRPSILTLDIETAPIESYHWGLWDQNIGLEQINVEWTILSYSAKWLHEEEMIFESTGGRGRDRVRDDVELLSHLWTLLDKADIVVTQNGKAFDMRKINARMIMQGIDRPYSPVKIVDTMLISKKHFEFTSNKLAWLSKYLTPSKKSEHKKFPGFELWSECLKDNAEAWAEMKHYNGLDVIATEQLYLKLRPWAEGHPNVAVYSDEEERRCPKCGGGVGHYGYAYTQTGKYDRFKCTVCGGFSRSRYTKNSADKRKKLLSN
jgi:hypothetical protein